MMEFFDKKLIFLNKNYATTDDLFEDLGGEILANGYGTTLFIEKLKEREGIFPTGLNLGSYGVAIPHTDPEYITSQFISVATLSQPVDFKAMDNIEMDVPVRLVFILGLKKAENQLLVLQKLMQVIQDPKLVEDLLQESKQQEILIKLEKYIN